MFFLTYLVWILNLFFGFLLYQFGYRTSLKNYILKNMCITFLILATHYTLIHIKYLHPILTCTPLFISLIKSLLDATKESRDLEKNLTQVILFLDLTSAKMKFGRGIKESMISSKNVLTNKTHLEFILKNNVVLQQPKSRFFSIFSELEGDLNAVIRQKVGQKDLIDHMKKKYQKRLILNQKTKIALSQYYSQSFVIGLFWLCAILFLIVQSLFSKYLFTIIFSFVLLMIGAWVSKKLLVITDFRI